jgi:[ribosomal protein S18]-alanine N-acetyltransferase
MQITCGDPMQNFVGRQRREAELPLSIRSLEPRDVESVLEIQAASPEIAQWALWDYDRVARGEMPGWIAEDDCKVAGFVVARRVVSDVEILNFAVRLDLRRRGIGSALIGAVFEWGKSFGAEKVILEVRASNLGALHFYERFGFEVSGRRPRYYAAPGDDALLLTVNLR